MFDNLLSGQIPSSIGNCRELKILALNYNNFTGYIPPELSQCAKMVSLSLCKNNLTGNIPYELSRMTSLRALYLHDNQLVGTVPAEFGTLSSLVHCYLHENALTVTRAVRQVIEKLPACDFRFRPSDRVQALLCQLKLAKCKLKHTVVAFRPASPTHIMLAGAHIMPLFQAPTPSDARSLPHVGYLLGRVTKKAWYAVPPPGEIVDGIWCDAGTYILELKVFEYLRTDATGNRIYKKPERFVTQSINLHQIYSGVDLCLQKATVWDHTSNAEFVLSAALHSQLLDEGQL